MVAGWPELYAKTALDLTKTGHNGPAGWECERIKYVLY